MKPVPSALVVLTILGAIAFSSLAAAQPALPPLQDEPGSPPPPPGPPERFVLEPGHWQWRPALGRYIWVRRHWIAAGPGFVHFVPGHWAGRAWIPAHWNR